MHKFESTEETEVKGRGGNVKRKMTKQLRKIPESREQNGSLSKIPGF